MATSTIKEQVSLTDFNNIGALKSVGISNTSINRVYRYMFGSAAIIYGLVTFSSTTAEISGLPTNGSGAYVPVSLFDIDAGSTKFFNLNPNATAVTLTGLTSSHYYVLMCVYSMN